MVKTSNNNDTFALQFHVFVHTAFMCHLICLFWSSRCQFTFSIYFVIFLFKFTLDVNFVYWLNIELLTLPSSFFRKFENFAKKIDQATMLSGYHFMKFI